MLKVSENKKYLVREADYCLTQHIAYWNEDDLLDLPESKKSLDKEEQQQLVDFIQAGPPKNWVYITGKLRIHEDGTNPECFYPHANAWYADRLDALWVRAYQMGLVIGDWKDKE